MSSSFGVRVLAWLLVLCVPLHGAAALSARVEAATAHFHVGLDAHDDDHHHHDGVGHHHHDADDASVVYLDDGAPDDAIDPATGGALKRLLIDSEPVPLAVPSTPRAGAALHPQTAPRTSFASHIADPPEHPPRYSAPIRS